MQIPCGFQNAILMREYDLTSALDFGFLNANRNPAACCRCENEMVAKTDNRQICPIEGLGSSHPQRDGRSRKNSFWSFRIRWPYLALSKLQPWRKMKNGESEFLAAVAVYCFRNVEEKYYLKK